MRRTNGLGDAVLPTAAVLGGVTGCRGARSLLLSLLNHAGGFVPLTLAFIAFSRRGINCPVAALSGFGDGLLHFAEKLVQR